MTEENYFKLYGWMLALDLNNAERLAYMVIYSFCGYNGFYAGGVIYLQNLFGWERHFASNTLKSLFDKGYIGKSIESGKVFYKILDIDVAKGDGRKTTMMEENLPNMVEILPSWKKSYHTPMVENLPSMEENLPNMVEILPQDGRNPSTRINNRINKRINNRNNIYSAGEKNETDKPKRKKRVTETYGEFSNVKLTEEEAQRLKDELGQEMFDKVVKYLDEYIEEKHYKSENHNLAIRRWVIEAVNRRKPASSSKLTDSYKMYAAWAEEG